MKKINTDKPRKFFVQVQYQDGNNYHPFYYNSRNKAIAKFNELVSLNGQFISTNAKSIPPIEYPEFGMDGSYFN
jgi:hypothetical protein